MDVRKACDVPKQRGKRRRCGPNEVADGRWRAARLDELLAQVDEMALHLRLAGPAEILLRDGDVGQRAGAVEIGVGADDLAVFERKRVERSAELVLRQDERRG